MIETRNSIRRLTLVMLGGALAGWAIGPVALAQTLESQLAAENLSDLVAAARERGDAQRGAIVFHQPALACARCHLPWEGQTPLGPELARLDPKANDEQLAEAILAPSKVVRPGYEPMTVVFTDGRTTTVLPVKETPETLIARDMSRGGAVAEFARRDIDQISRSTLSIMPAGQVNQLAGRQQFLDLVKYLMEIRDGGPDRAAQLVPPSHLLGPLALPEYENRVDHGGLLASLDDASLRRGEAIYQRLCVNCHGTHDQPGSLPTSLRFATGTFKNGADPLSMYRTLTFGFGMMTPQTWMVPQQKYDVIHYIRETYLRPRNPSQFTSLTSDYLAGLPHGDTRGPAPVEVREWERMDYGRNLMATYEVGDNGENLVYKGNAIRLDDGSGGVSRGLAWMVYDCDTLRAGAAWSGRGFIDWNCVHFSGQHAVHPRIVGRVEFTTPMGPGWARPGTDSFDGDDRVIGRDGRAYGPLPRDWAHYEGMYQHGSHVVMRYTVGDTEVLEWPKLIDLVSFAGDSTVTSSTPATDTAANANVGAGAAGSEWRIFERVFSIGPRSTSMLLRVAQLPDLPSDEVSLITDHSHVVFGKVEASGDGPTRPPTAGDSREMLVAALSGSTEAPGSTKASRLTGASGLKGATFLAYGNELRLQLPAGEERLCFALRLARVPNRHAAKRLVEAWPEAAAVIDPRTLTQGGPARWPERLEARTETLGRTDGPFVVDMLTHPVDNPWFCRMRLSGFDFLPDGDRAAVCDWEGNVWIVSGLSALGGDDSTGRHDPVTLTWKRIASGLFQPLGLLYHKGALLVTCRDQICRLYDLNGDEEIDFYENVNNDHQVTEHFHEFAMGLQADSQGNLYYAKSARHALPSVVPHHGTLLKVSADGLRTEIVATGFRAANGVCLNPDGTFFVTDQEGHWTPKNRINWVKPGGFYGNMFAYHDVKDESDLAMEPPLCWITNAFDRSPGELLWVTSPRWGALRGSLLNLSYGYGKIFIVPHERIGDRMQGGMSELPIGPFPTGGMRGRFSPQDGQLYSCGMFAWAGNQEQPGGFYRVRYTGRPLHAPTGLSARVDGLAITFSEPVDAEAAADPKRYDVRAWSLRRSADYGSDHHDTKKWAVRSARLLPDQRTVLLDLPELAPTWCMEIQYALVDRDGNAFQGKVHNTIHELKPSK